MRLIKFWQVDAFTDRPFHGNPAAVCWLDQAEPDDWLQAVTGRGDQRGSGDRLGPLLSRPLLGERLGEGRVDRLPSLTTGGEFSTSGRSRIE